MSYLGVFYGTFHLFSALLRVSRLEADRIAISGRSHGDSQNSRKHDNANGYGLSIWW
jgi:hypothetical protein